MDVETAAISRFHRSLTVGAQGGRQHLNALVSDGVPGGEVRGQRTPGGHGAGGGGGGSGGVGFGLPGKEQRGALVCFGPFRKS